eukprot:308833-Chlamydomonas_euryale.AAC.1
MAPPASRQSVCCPMDDVRPVASSCANLKTLERARPRPSSSIERVRTPTMVDLPLRCPMCTCVWAGERVRGRTSEWVRGQVRDRFLAPVDVSDDRHANLGRRRVALGDRRELAHQHIGSKAGLCGRAQPAPDGARSRRCGSAAVRQRKGAAVQRSGSAKVRQCSGEAAQRCGGAAVRQRKGAAVQRSGSAKVQQCSGEAAQR